MNNIGSFGGDVNRPIQNRLPPAPLPLSVTTSDAIVSKPIINDQFIRDTGNPVIANLGLPPKNEKNNSSIVDDAWGSFAVATETTDANAVLVPVLNAKAPVVQLIESPEGKESVTAELTRHIIGGPDTSRVLGIMDNLA